MLRRCALLSLLACTWPATAAPRAGAVFILGVDAPQAPPYYAAAREYHAHRIDADRDVMVVAARSWMDVREVLAAAPQRGAQPWGDVVLVVHGSQWIGTSLPLYRDGQAARASDIERALASGEFPALPDDVLDARSTLRIESCGVGRRADLLQLYARLLGGDGQRPRIEGNAELTEYGWHDDGRANASAHSWRRDRPYLLGVHAGDMPRAVPQAIADAYRERYGADALAAATPRLLPVQLRLPLGDGLCGDRAAAGRLAHRADVAAALRDYGLRPSDLRWRIERGEDGCTLRGAGYAAGIDSGGPIELPWAVGAASAATAPRPQH